MRSAVVPSRLCGDANLLPCAQCLMLVMLGWILLSVMLRTSTLVLSTS